MITGFITSGRYAIVKIENLDQGGEIVGVVVEIVAVPGVAGLAAASAVVGDRPEAVVSRERA
jgi:hypothetical protein